MASDPKCLRNFISFLKNASEFQPLHWIQRSTAGGSALIPLVYRLHIYSFTYLLLSTFFHETFLKCIPHSRMGQSLKLHYLRDTGIFILLLVEGNPSERDNYKTMTHLILPSPITYSMPWKNAKTNKKRSLRELAVQSHLQSRISQRVTLYVSVFIITWNVFE